MNYETLDAIVNQIMDLYQEEHGLKPKSFDEWYFDVLDADVATPNELRLFMAINDVYSDM